MVSGPHVLLNSFVTESGTGTERVGVCAKPSIRIELALDVAAAQSAVLVVLVVLDIASRLFVL